MTTNQFPAEKVVATGERGNIVEGEPPLLLLASRSAENSPIVLNRAELAKKGATLATAASNDPDDGQQECAQQ
jgi:hypothetical protein